MTTAHDPRPIREWSRWVVLIAYSALILATLSLVRALRDLVVERWGERGFSLAVWALFALVGILFLAWVIRQSVLRSVGRAALLLLACTAYAYMLLRLDLAVERLHYIEYGLVAVLALRAFEVQTRDWAAYLLACLYVLGLGLLDEAIQWILPTRVGEFRDVNINLTAGVLGLVPVIASRAHPFAFVHRESLARVLRWSAGVAALTALFLTFVHGFGFMHRSSGHAWFRSVFPPDSFSEYGQHPEAVAYREFPDSPISHPGEGPLGWIGQRFLQWRLLRNPTPEAYNYEAWRHRQLRDGLETPRYAQYREALEEERILTRVFGAYLRCYGVAWPENKRRKFADLPFAGSSTYLSPAQELLITWVRPEVFWVASGLVVVALVSASILVGRSGKRSREP
ncbi:VanZ family protein [Candidatus Fermentibacteria bacterium]|nr:VanZ family protein [Candidatus Fermentibacteria bacterium]